MAPQFMQKSPIQWQVSLVRGFGQYFLEIMEGSDDSDWGPIFSIWNLLMILLFGFISKKIYDCIGARGEDTPSEPVAIGNESEKDGAKDGEKKSGDSEKSATESGVDKLKSGPAGSAGPATSSRVEDVRAGAGGAAPQEKSGSASSKDKDGAGKVIGSGEGSSVDSGEGKDVGTEKVAMQKEAGLKSQYAPGLFGKSTDPVMQKVGEITDEMKGMSEEERKKFEQDKQKLEQIQAERVETIATGRPAGDSGIGDDLNAELKKKEEEERKKKEEEERKKKEEEERKKKEEAERKRKEEEEERKRKEEEERKRKEEEEKKKKEEELKRKQEEEKKKREEEAELKRKQEEEDRKKEEERKKKEEEDERKRKEEEEKKRKEEEDRQKEETERKKKEEEEQRKKEEEEKKKREEEEKRRQEEELKQKQAEEERKKKEEEEQKKKETEALKQQQEEEEKKRKEEEEKKKQEELQKIEIQRADELKSLQMGAGDDPLSVEEEFRRQQEKQVEEMKKAQEQMKNLGGASADRANEGTELDKKVDELFNLEDDSLLLRGTDENGKEVEKDYVMISPPHSPLQQVVAPPLLAAEKEEDKEVTARKRQQVQEVMAVVSQEKHNSVSDLVHDLTVGQNKTTDFDKARALFIWLSSKDLKNLTFMKGGPGSDEEKLTGLQTGDSTYAQVYQTLCQNAGLDCELIHGYAKGVGYKPGMRFEGDNFRHSWNAVKVDGDWRLVDPNWGARHVVGKKEGSPVEEQEASDENTVYELDEYYFLPQAWELIHSHYPDEPEWQLREPITKEQFENLVLCKSPFFKHNLRIKSHSEAVIKINKEAEVQVKCPNAHRDRLVFIFTLAYADSLNAAEDSHEGTPLGNFGMQRMMANVSSVFVRPPAPGEYRLVIHVKDLSKPQRVPGKFYYSEVCEYGVVVSDAYNPPRPFPPCAHTSWGKGDSMARYSTDLIPQRDNIIIPTRKGVAEVNFSLKNKLRFLAKLKSASVPEVDRYVIHRVVGDEAVFTVRPPKNGEYGLEVYANNKEVDGTTMHHVYQYLVIARDISETVEPYPQLPSTFLGPQGNFDNFGMQLASHKDPLITTDDGSVSIEFKNSQPMKLMSQLIFVSEGKQEDNSSFVLQNTTEDSIKFRAELPKRGSYKFTLFGVPVDMAGDNVPSLYNCLIECRRGNDQAVPFPKQFSQWKNSGVLKSPTTGQLGADSSPTKFDLEINGAHSVAVVIGDDWTQLAKNNSGAWTGEVDISQFVGKQQKCVICANMDDNEATFSTLLEFSIAN